MFHATSDRVASRIIKCALPIRQLDRLNGSGRVRVSRSREANLIFGDAAAVF